MRKVNYFLGIWKNWIILRKVLPQNLIPAKDHSRVCEQRNLIPAKIGSVKVVTNSFCLYISLVAIDHIERFA